MLINNIINNTEFAVVKCDGGAWLDYDFSITGIRMFIGYTVASNCWQIFATRHHESIPDFGTFSSSDEAYFFVRLCQDV